jgi:hypothetical protein
MKYSSFDYEVATTKSEILDWMGFQPTLLYDPGYGLGGKPAPGTAVWRYRLCVPPFKSDLGLEFDGDRLAGISQIPPEYIHFKEDD